MCSLEVWVRAVFTRMMHNADCRRCRTRREQRGSVVAAKDCQPIRSLEAVLPSRGVAWVSSTSQTLFSLASLVTSIHCLLTLFPHASCKFCLPPCIIQARDILCTEYLQCHGAHFVSGVGIRSCNSWVCGRSIQALISCRVLW